MEERKSVFPISKWEHPCSSAYIRRYSILFIVDSPLTHNTGRNRCICSEYSERNMRPSLRLCYSSRLSLFLVRRSISASSLVAISCLTLSVGCVSLSITCRFFERNRNNHMRHATIVKATLTIRKKLPLQAESAIGGGGGNGPTGGFIGDEPWSVRFQVNRLRPTVAITMVAKPKMESRRDLAGADR